MTKAQLSKEVLGFVFFDAIEVQTAQAVPF